MPGPCRSASIELDETPFTFFYEDDFGHHAPSGQLGDLITSVTNAFEAERARGHRLDNRQDPASFKRLNSRITSLLKSYSSWNCGDWRRYSGWSEHGYVRHLLWETEEFELMVICWSPGQTSRVHNHADSHCWLTVLDGEVCETQYQAAGGVAAAKAGAAELVPTSTADLQTGEVAYINDHIALHSVGCPGGDQRREAAGAATPACTLHLYCPPIRRVKAYEDGRVVERIPGFYSRHAVAGAAPQLEACYDYVI